ncbi:Single-stranded DNA-binding protein [compost metagenome]|uniref:single-stranded DNA-binding protein n=1 Tax=Pedobacter sp. ok626 TaxID=1761882 RepID=UPI0008910FBE|nr:single-stranded DNA-binding protein [Pedobacter sp. ok626]SDL22089.1 single-strand DNA-binding protein [Pedobacter sp. ok626]
MEKVRNSVRLTGFAGTDPIIINFANEKRLARISIAVNEVYKNSLGVSMNQTQWFNLIFWNKKVELVERAVRKGTRFSIEGKLNIQSYKDKSGEMRYSTEVVVNTMELDILEIKRKPENKEKVEIENDEPKVQEVHQDLIQPYS